MTSPRCPVAAWQAAKRSSKRRTSPIALNMPVAPDRPASTSQTARSVTSRSALRSASSQATLPSPYCSMVAWSLSRAGRISADSSAPGSLLSRYTDRLDTYTHRRARSASARTAERTYPGWLATSTTRPQLWSGRPS
jgi:hypothetical protein